MAKGVAVSPFDPQLWLSERMLRQQDVLKTLRRFKDEVREVQQGYECGMAFENYDDIKVGDVIECFDVEEVKPTL